MQKESKAKLKKLIVAFVAAIALSAAQIWIAISFSKKIIWQSYIMLLAVGHGPILGYDASGNPKYEGTPVHMVAACFGILFGVVIYTALFYLLIKMMCKLKKQFIDERKQ